ncbi:concanavalin A-like lectin/glucanase domain-containing protein, partial [Blakeslea trispora]
SWKTIRNKSRAMWRMGQCWNKQLSYCTAFSIYGAIDVTKKYVRDWPTVLKRRTRVHEAALSLFLEDLTNKYQEHLDDSERQLLRDKRMKEFFELEKESQKIIVKDNELTGRISGALDWRLQRGETGNTFSSKMSSFDTNAYRNLLSQTPLIRLTKAVSDQCGGVYFRQPILIDSTLKGIEVEFAFCVSDGQGGPTMGGADGFAFVLQSEHERALGHGGCQLGYGGIKNSLAVEFDTYQSTDRCADPSNNHISIQARKASQPNSAHHDYSLGHSSRVPLFQSGQWFKSKVRLLTNGVIEIGVAETNVKQDYRQVLKVSNHNFLDYVGTINKSVWLGFTASTGGLSECHDIQWISFTELRVGELIVC